MNRLYTDFFKKYFLILAFFLPSLTAYTQTGCGCPSACEPCAGGIVILTLKYTGIFPAYVRVFDNSPSAIFTGMLNTGDEFTLNGGTDGKFEGNDLDFFIGPFPVTSIDVSCSFIFDPSIEYAGLFATVSAYSKQGGLLCCTSNIGDTTPPVISGCPLPNTIVPATNGCSGAADWSYPQVTDCSPFTFDNGGIDPGHVFPIGPNTVVYSYKDINNNTSTCIFTITVKDVTPPVLVTSPGTVTLSADPITCKAVAQWNAPSFTDNCSAVTLSYSHPLGTLLSPGTREVTCTAKDNSGNTTLCNFNVTVTDQTLPVVSNCPGPITLTANANCKANATWTPPVFTDCNNLVVTPSHEPGSEFPIGITLVTYSGSDAAGNITLCTFNVEVKDVIVPVISGCPTDITVNTTDLSGTMKVDWDPVVMTDDCGLSVESASHESGEFFPVGTTLVTYTAKDYSENVATCTFNVTVLYENANLEIERLITPDGNGVNDEWVIGNIDKYKTNKVVIVDRWGSLIYSESGYNNNNKVWNGQNSNGNAVPTGTYFFTISVQSGPTSVEKKGFIELVR